MNAGRLFHLPPLVQGAPHVRTLLVSEEVDGDVHPPWPENRDGERHAEFRAALDTFTEGNLISVADNPLRKPANAFMARVDPVQDNVFDIRSYRVPQGVRCFGCFAAKDLFIALTWNYRENIVDWADEVTRCRTEWNRLFSPLQPLTGASLDEYVSNFYPV